jgi:16S rRNA (cytidine1402-2'-O)-methyltransferase
MVFYESPMRLVKTLDQMAEYFGADRPCAVSRELTKKFEEIRRGSIAEVAGYFREKGVKGEIVIVVGGAAPSRGIGKKDDEDA